MLKLNVKSSNVNDKTGGVKSSTRLRSTRKDLSAGWNGNRHMAPLLNRFIREQNDLQQGTFNQLIMPQYNEMKRCHILL